MPLRFCVHLSLNSPSLLCQFYAQVSFSGGSNMVSGSIRHTSYQSDTTSPIIPEKPWVGVIDSARGTYSSPIFLFPTMAAGILDRSMGYRGWGWFQPYPCYPGWIQRNRASPKGTKPLLPLEEGTQVANKRPYNWCVWGVKGDRVTVMSGWGRELK